MSKMIVKNAVPELGGQFVVLKREKVTEDGKRGIRSEYTVLDGDTLQPVWSGTDKAEMRGFIEDQEWGQKAKEREAKRGGLAETLAGQDAKKPEASTKPTVVDDEDDDEVDAEPQLDVASQIQQPPV